ncbi:MAG TPA: chemotaxis protein CheW [Labilithrix sp.]|nr:chemotaxis protein CheW [Labilithrix sp.]
MQVDLREFRGAYLAEVDEHLGAIDTLLLSVERASRANKPAPRDLRELMRLLHTIKGLSAMVGIEPIVTLAHRMENVLRAADDAGGLLGDRALEALIAGARAVETRVRAVANGEPVTEPAASTLAALDATDVPSQRLSPADASLDPEIAGKLTTSEREQIAQGAAEGRRALRVDFAPAPAKAARGQTITSVRERLAAVGEIVRVLPIAMPASETTPGGLVFAVILLTEVSADDVAHAASLAREDIREILAARSLPLATPGVEPALDHQAEVEPIEPQRPGVLRVDVARIDDAIEKLSGLIVTRSRLSRAIAKLREAGVNTRDLETIMVDNARQLRDLRGAILRVRMVPIGSVLDRLPLVIRGLGRSTGKQVRLVLEGGGAELDKTVAERLFPALVHLLRNAVDHGLETPAERVRAGKPPQATVTVTSASRNNRQIEIRVQDDGRGVDRERLARKAGQEAPADDGALLELLCRPGLSTRDEVDTTSGRGVGMDIVHKIVVDGLGGELTLETQAGQGTTFVLRVPVTIAIVDAFSLHCAGERFVVPVPVVEEIVELDAARIVRGPRVRGHETRFFTRRGETVPVVDLARALGLSAAAAQADSGKQALVVRRGHDEPVAFVIDRILGRQETVIRPLADPLVTVLGVTGSTDLGDGRATLVLDLLGLCAKLGRHSEHAA